MGGLRGDVGVEVLVADIDDDVDVVDVEKRVGVVGQLLLDGREEGGLGDGLGGEHVVVVLVLLGLARYLDTEGVAIFAIIEDHGGLVETAPREGVPPNFVWVLTGMKPK